MDASESAALLRPFQGSPLYLPVLLTLGAGMRRGQRLGRASVVMTLDTHRHVTPTLQGYDERSSRRRHGTRDGFHGRAQRASRLPVSCDHITVRSVMPSLVCVLPARSVAEILTV